RRDICSLSRTLPPPRPTLLPYTTLFRSRRSGPSAPQPAVMGSHHDRQPRVQHGRLQLFDQADRQMVGGFVEQQQVRPGGQQQGEDRKSTRLNSSHVKISYAVFCLKKKKK